MVHCLADGSLRTVVTLAGIVAVVLAIERPLAHCDGRAVVVSIAPFWLALTPRRPVVRVTNERLSAATLRDVILRSAHGVLTTEGGRATSQTTSDAIVIDAADLVVPAVAVAPTFGSWSASLPNIVGNAFKTNPALAGGSVVGSDAVCIWPATPIPAGICAVLDAIPCQ